MCALFHKHLSQHGVRSRDQQLLCIFAHPWSVEFHSENAEICCCSVTKWYPTLCSPKDYSIPGSLSFTISWNLLRFISPESVMLSNHFILCHPLLLLPSVFSTSGSFSMSQLFISGGQHIGTSASASVLPKYIQGWFSLWLMVSSPCCPRNSQESSLEPQFKSISSLGLSLLYGPILTSVSHYWKNHSIDYTDLCQKSGLCFLICCLVLSAFPLRSKHLLIPWLQLPSTVILEPKKIKSVIISIVFPSICLARRKWNIKK